MDSVDSILREDINMTLWRGFSRAVYCGVGQVSPNAWSMCLFI